MNRKLFLIAQVVLLALVGSAVGTAAGRLSSPPSPAQRSPDLAVSPLTPVGSGFTYQGRLMDGGSPANGQYDFVFTLFDVPTGGSPVSSPITVTSQMVTDGLVTVVLDFGLTAFQGEERYLDISVRPASVGLYTTLIPRQAMTPAPYSLSAPWLGTSGKPADYNPLRFANSLSTLDSAGAVGLHTSVTVGSDGLGLVSYFDNTNDDLKVAHCDNPVCTSATTFTLDSTGSVGEYTSVTVGSDGLGLISYFDNTNGDLKVAYCDNVKCTSATTFTLDSSGLVGSYTSVTVGSDGLGLISYYDDTNDDLKVAHCNNTSCTGATISTLDSTGFVGSNTSVTIGSDGLGLISYLDNNPNVDLKVAHCNNPLCTSATTSTLDSTGSVGFSTSVTVGSDGLGLVSYSDISNSDLKVAHCNNTSCSSATTSTLDSTASVGSSTSVTVGSDGLGLVSYLDISNSDLKVAHCNNASCTGATTSTLDSIGGVGAYTSVTVGVDGLPLISHRDFTNDDLKVVHCGSPFCVPYHHRR